MEKLQKCVNFILTVPVFFCNQLYVCESARRSKKEFSAKLGALRACPLFNF
jgi:hypothetical protein